MLKRQARLYRMKLHTWAIRRVEQIRHQRCGLVGHEVEQNPDMPSIVFRIASTSSPAPRSFPDKSFPVAPLVRIPLALPASLCFRSFSARITEIARTRGAIRKTVAPETDTFR